MHHELLYLQYFSVKYWMLNTRFMHAPAFMYKIFKRTITKEKNDRQCYREQKDKRKEGKSEKRQEERGEEK